MSSGLECRSLLLIRLTTNLKPINYLENLKVFGVILLITIVG